MKKEGKKDRGLLIAISIVVGIVLSCAMLPLGGMALFMATKEANHKPSPAIEWQERIVSGEGPNRVLILQLDGFIGTTDHGAMRELISQIKQANEDPLIKAVVLRINSPGGSVVGSNEIYHALKELAENKKPLVVSMGTVAASGGYYIAAAAERIYANPDTLTGSLGVIISSINYEDAYDKIGLQQMVYKSGEFKDILSPAREPTNKEEKILQDIVDQAYQGFVDVIVEGRELPRKKVLDIADGRVYTGKQALDLDLVDKLGNIEDAIEGAKDLAGLEDALVVRYRPNNSIQDLLLYSMTQAQQPADPLGLRQLTEPDMPRLEYRLVW